MDTELPVSFRNRLKQAFDRSEFSSFRALSLASGLSESRVHRIMQGQFDNSKDGPGFFNIVRLAKQLGVTPDHLAGIDKWSRTKSSTKVNATALIQSIEAEMNKPSVPELMRRYVRSGQRLEAFTDLLEYCDIYETPDTATRKVQIRRIGEKSLAALGMGECNPAILQEAYDRAEPEFQEQIFKSHLRASENGVTVEPDFINQRMENRPIHVRIEYMRTAMLLSDANQKQCLLIFCELIPQ